MFHLTPGERLVWAAAFAAAVPKSARAAAQVAADAVWMLRQLPSAGLGHVFFHTATPEFADACLVAMKTGKEF